MPYIGRGTDKLSNVEVLDNITFDGSSSYTLQKGGSNFTPSSANTLLVSIDGVVQAGNFTVSGSTIDFGTAVAGTSTCDFILHYGTGLITTPADGTVTSAKISYPLTTFSSTGIDDNATANALTIDSSSNLQFNSGYGSVATAYGCRAWINFDGTGTPSIKASGNVSSITDYGVGDFGINFTTAMPDTNYACTAQTIVGNENATATPYTTSQVAFVARTITGTNVDRVTNQVIVFR